MNCKNCGAVLSPNSTICSMCGTPVEKSVLNNENNQEQDVLELIPNESEVTNVSSVEPPVESSNNQPTVELPVQNETPVETPIVEIVEPAVQTPVQNIDNKPVVENNVVNNVEVTKKDNDKLFYIILAILSVAIVGSVVYLLFFANK